MLGGRIAEEIFVGHKSSGASDDLKRATDLVSMMVRDWAMSDKFAPRTFGTPMGSPFLGKALTRDRDYSEAKAEEIDREIDEIINKGSKSISKSASRERKVGKRRDR